MKFPVRIIVALFICLMVVVVYRFYTERERKDGTRHVNKKMAQVSDRNFDRGTTRAISLVDHLHRRNKIIASSRVHSRATVDICTIDILELLNKKQSSMFEVKIDKDIKHVGRGINNSLGSEVNSADTLHVIVIPHSHNDAGWVKTLDEYFHDQTKPTLDNMVEKLMKYPDMKFVWVETVFLSMWWKVITEETKKNVRYLIDRRQLEIVVGGWVVPDEANPHYYAIIDQMILGHQWLEKNLGVRPRNSWSVDPFGYSAIMPYLYKRAGFENVVILRVNSDVKKELEVRRALEFNWRQTWDGDNTTDICTLMMPYMLYSIKHSCGPDQRVCMKFDFRQIPGEIKETRAHTVTGENVVSLAEQLLNQYRRKAALYRHNVVLIPLGDDFRYDKELEWDQQYENYRKLFSAMNSRTDWNVNARFGTLQDYFDQVNRVLESKQVNRTEFFPSLSGDFFPYTDRNEDYWSGYFTTRPFAKSLSRDVEVHLRSADILNTFYFFSLSFRKFDQQLTVKKEENINRLARSRQHLALFQHHDAITGTDKAYVARDYENRLNEALQLSRYSIRDAMALIYGQTRGEGLDDVPIRVLDPLSDRILKPSETVVHIPPSGVNLVIFNNLAHDRKELIKLTVDLKTVRVIDERGSPVVTQTVPVWDNIHDEIKDLFEIAFLVDLPALSLVTLRLVTSKPSVNSTNQSSVTLFNKNYSVQGFSETSANNVTIENYLVKAIVSVHNGQLEQLILKHDGSNPETLHKVNMKLLTYKASGSGAYIFSPRGPPTEEHFRSRPVITLITGPLFSEIRIAHKSVTQILRVVNTLGFIGGAISVENLVDITELDETELIMRLNTDIADAGVFYTDQNGHHTVRRERFPRLPREANYYPLTSVMYMNDSTKRLSLITAQPMGASSQLSGGMEVMLDRRLRFDDGRGMGEAVLDNKPVLIKFLILLETKLASSRTEEQSHQYGGCLDCLVAPSLPAHVLSERLRNYPVLALGTPSDKIRSGVSMLSKPLPCDVSLVSFRMLGVDGIDVALKIETSSLHTAVVILHRREYSSDYETFGSESECSAVSEGIDLENVFRDMSIHKIIESTLSLMYTKRRLTEGELVTLKPNEIYAFKFTFR